MQNIEYFNNLFRDLSSTSLMLAGVLTAHTRPVEAIDARIISSSTIELCTGDTMGTIKLWVLEREVEPNATDVHWRSNLKAEYHHHRTRINELRIGTEQLWTGRFHFFHSFMVHGLTCGSIAAASADDTVQIISLVSPETAPITLPHPKSVRAILPLSLTELAEHYLISATGDVIRVYDVAALDDPEILLEVDAHWHDVTALRLWDRIYTRDDGQPRREPWIVSASLDGTLRKWNLQGMSPVCPRHIHEDLLLISFYRFNFCKSFNL
jgi:WD40 repeat protein